MTLSLDVSVSLRTTRYRRLNNDESILWEKVCPKCKQQEMIYLFDYAKTKAYINPRCRQPECKYGN